jgi:pimeloyl-ACP methyl ester carboxylesterase
MKPTLDIIKQTVPNPKATIVFCHGAWHDNRCWVHTLIPYFTEKGYNCVAPSYRNHGKSESVGSLKLCRIKEYVKDVKSVVDTIEGKIYLIGHSMGGMVVQKFLEKYGEKISKATLICSVPPQGVWRVTLKNIIKLPLEFLKVNLTWSLYPMIGSLNLARTHFYTTQLSEKELETRFAELQDESFLAFLDMLFLDLPKPNRIKTPIQVIGGEKDYIFPPADVQNTAKAYNTEAQIWKNEAHNLFLEQNWCLVADTINHFIEEE